MNKYWVLGYIILEDYINIQISLLAYPKPRCYYLKLNKYHSRRGSHSFVGRYLKISPIWIYTTSSLKAACFKIMSSRLGQPYVIFLTHMFITSTNKYILSAREINLNTVLFSLHYCSMKCRILLSSPFRDKEIKVSWLITQWKDTFKPRRSDTRGWCLVPELSIVWWCDMMGLNGIIQGMALAGESP